MIRAASRETLADTIGRLRTVAGEAVDTLREALRDDLTSNRISAAVALLDTAVKVEVDDLARRVDTIEARQRLTASLDAAMRQVRQLDSDRG